MQIVHSKATSLSQVIIDQDLTMGAYHIVLGDSKLKSTSHLLREEDDVWLALRNIADDDYSRLKSLSLAFSVNLAGLLSGAYLLPPNSDDTNLGFKARDSGVGLVEVARLVGAAEPYFQFTLAQRLLPKADPATLVEGMIWYNATDDKVKIRKASTTEYLELPSGAIIMWHGTIANIPVGFLICDGNNGTPNLLAKFVHGVATAATNPGTTGGADTHTHGIGGESNIRGTGGGYVATAGTTDADGALPPYYDVAFIMKA